MLQCCAIVWMVCLTLNPESQFLTLSGLLLYQLYSSCAVCKARLLAFFQLPRCIVLYSFFGSHFLVGLVRAIVLVRLVNHVVENKSLLGGFSAAGDVVCMYPPSYRSLLCYANSVFSLAPRHLWKYVLLVVGLPLMLRSRLNGFGQVSSSWAPSLRSYTLFLVCTFPSLHSFTNLCCSLSRV
jgi:hypothetical protein